MSFDLLQPFGALALVAFVFVLALVWSRSIGASRAFLAAVFRVFWILPLFLICFPGEKRIEKPRTFLATEVAVFVDDSVSMKAPGRDIHVKNYLRYMDRQCVRIGCRLTITRLSQVAPKLVEKGYSPLGEALPPWLIKNQDQPWILISDGENFRPRSSFSLKTQGKQGFKPLVIYPFELQGENFILDQIKGPDFFFESKPISMEVVVQREGDLSKARRVQLQVSVAGKTVQSINMDFPRDQKKVRESLMIPGLKRGSQNVSVELVPIPDEMAKWDNEQSFQLDILPNTLGILHLLGAPGWDGRFVRRYLKAEPKYDLISFFILRDPSDNTRRVDERELSLIPFPTDRLFNQELGNFKVLVMQNFNFSRFLETSYKENLVKFVKSGGGLLFIGGSRALSDADLSDSPLKEILPFEYSNTAQKDSNANGGGMDWLWRGRQKDLSDNFDPQLEFKVQIASPNSKQRKFATVFDHWKKMESALTTDMGFKGMHRTDQFKFDPEKSTPLLEAKTKDGRTLPLAVASYPGKGRALWIFSDQFWRYSLDDKSGIMGSFYSRFMQASMSWLMKNEFNRPLQLRDLSLDQSTKVFKLIAHGPAVDILFERNGQWAFKVCGESVDLKQIEMNRRSKTEIQLVGKVAGSLVNRKRCNALIKGQYSSFGEASASASGIVHEELLDQDVGPSKAWLNGFVKHTSSKFIQGGLDDVEKEKLDQWFSEVLKNGGVSLPPQIDTQKDYYWFLTQWWIWLCFLGLPLEVLTRRWHLLM